MLADMLLMGQKEWHCRRQFSLLTATLCRSMIDGMRKIIGSEGPQGLWRGVNVSLLISVPTIMLYLPLYDQLVTEFSSLGGYAPFVAGAVSRTASVVCTSPLEVRSAQNGASVHD